MVDVIFSQYSFILIVFYFGFDLYREGIQRLNGTTDYSIIEKIPDKELIAVIHKAEQLNIESGFLYKNYIGPFLMVSAVLMFVLIVIFQKKMPDIRTDIRIEFLVFFSLQITVFWITNFMKEILEDGYVTKFGIMFRMAIYKKLILYLYKSIGFLSIHTNEKEVDRYKKEDWRYLKKIPTYFKYVCIGFYIWYINLVLFFLFILGKLALS